MIIFQYYAKEYAKRIVREFVANNKEAIEECRKQNFENIELLPLSTLRAQYLKHVCYTITSQTNFLNMEIVNQILKG